MEQTPLLRLKRVSKSYPGVQALKDADLELYAGEVHFLIGENGAGKSTLMKILSGSVQKDSGQIIMEGHEINIVNPTDARRQGITMVYQEFSLMPALSVAENIFVGAYPMQFWGRLVDWGKIYNDTEEVLKSVGLHISPSKLVKDLTVSERQLVEIAKALSRNARVLLLDEPTSALSTEETEKLFQLIKDLQKRRIAILYVSHRLIEVPLIAQKVTVMRDGRKIDTLPVSQADEAKLVNMMVGREITDRYPKEIVEIGEPALEIQSINLKDRIKDVSLNVHRGEIVGVFGLMGAGRTSLANVIFGMERPDSGTIKVYGMPVNIKTPNDAIRAGLGYITEDRRNGLVHRMSIAANITFPILHKLIRAAVLRLSMEKALATRYKDELKISAPTIQQLCEYLSGGNQQKVVLARWMCSQSKVVIFDEPTRGIDVGSKVEVYRLMGQMAREGVALLVSSSELPELLGVSDRILVMCGGEIVGSYYKNEVTPDEIMFNAAGRRKACG